MKYVKANLDVVICGVVMLLALGLCFWPTASWDAAKQEELTQRYNQVKAARALITNIEIVPGGPVIKQATIEQNVIDEKRRALDKMSNVAKRVAALAAQQNEVGRIIPAKPGGPQHEIPMLSEQRREDNFLPAVVRPADPMGFRLDYEQQFAAWLQKMNAGVPPSKEEVTAAINERTAELTHAAAATGALWGGSPNGPGQLSVRDQQQIKRSLVYARASKINIYVDDNALQRRVWGQGTPPTEPQIFEALVDTWFQQDVINAIITLNNKVLDKQTEKNVGHSAVKRLESIIVGNGAAGTSTSTSGPGTLFMTIAPSGPAAMGGSGAGPGFASPGAPVNGIDRSRSLTGHVGDNEYDVVLMKVVVDIDPAYENQFIDQLYRQNNGYTVLNRNLRAVDPLDAASNGYLYGPTQVVRLEFLVEGLLFRSWTVPIMPWETKASLGIVTAPAKPGGMR